MVHLLFLRPLTNTFTEFYFIDPLVRTKDKGFLKGRFIMSTPLAASVDLMAPQSHLANN